MSPHQNRSTAAENTASRQAGASSIPAASPTILPGDVEAGSPEADLGEGGSDSPLIPHTAWTATDQRQTQAKLVGRTYARLETRWIDQASQGGRWLPATTTELAWWLRTDLETMQRYVGELHRSGLVDLEPSADGQHQLIRSYRDAYPTAWTRIRDRLKREDSHKVLHLVRRLEAHGCPVETDPYKARTTLDHTPHPPLLGLAGGGDLVLPAVTLPEPETLSDETRSRLETYWTAGAPMVAVLTWDSHFEATAGAAQAWARIRRQRREGFGFCVVAVPHDGTGWGQPRVYTDQADHHSQPQ